MIPNMMWFGENIAYKSELRQSISNRDSPSFPVLTMLASKGNVHHFLLLKADRNDCKIEETVARFVRHDPASKSRVDICKNMKTGAV